MRKNQKFSVGVIGLGYVGLPMLHLLSKKMDYYGFDKDPKKINLLKKTNLIFQMSPSEQLKIINKK